MSRQTYSDHGEWRTTIGELKECTRAGELIESVIITNKDNNTEYFHENVMECLGGDVVQLGINTNISLFHNVHCHLLKYASGLQFKKGVALVERVDAEINGYRQSKAKCCNKSNTKPLIGNIMVSKTRCQGSWF